VSFIGPFITLEEIFGSGVTTGGLADLIRLAEQNEAPIPRNFGDFIFDGNVVGTLIFDVFQNLFFLLDKPSGRIIRSAPTTQGIRDSLTAPQGEPGPVGPAGPEGASPDLNAIIAAVTNIIGSLNRAPTTGRVDPGGSVNAPVVLGSAADPRGAIRPEFPAARSTPGGPAPPTLPPAPPGCAEWVSAALNLATQIRNERALRDAQRRQSELLANAAEFQRRQAMPFGQAGFVGSLPAVGGTIGGIVGSLGADAIEALLRRLTGGGDVALPSLPAFPVLPQLPPGIPGLSGGAAACPSLFRGAAPQGMRVSPVPWFPVQAPNGKWFFFGHLGTPTFSKLKARRKHHHHSRKR